MPASRPGPKPRGPFRDKRRTLTTRITEGTRVKLDEAAALAGRSLSQEIEFRLEQSFQQNELLGEFKHAFDEELHRLREEQRRENQRSEHLFQSIFGEPVVSNEPTEIKGYIRQVLRQVDEAWRAIMLARRALVGPIERGFFDRGDDHQNEHEPNR